MRQQKIVPHPALKSGQKTLRILLNSAHQISQRIRKRIEEIFGWTKTTGGFRKSRYHGVERTHAQGQYVTATWNLVRMAKLMSGDPPQAARGLRPAMPRCVQAPRKRRTARPNATGVAR
jgi:hypothetical protein